MDPFKNPFSLSLHFEYSRRKCLCYLGNSFQPRAYLSLSLAFSHFFVVVVVISRYLVASLWVAAVAEHDMLFVVRPAHLSSITWNVRDIVVWTQCDAMP